MFATRARRWCALTLLFTAVSPALRADEPWAEMLRRVPGTTNAIAIIDVKALDNSAIGKREGWKDRRQLLADGASFLPKNVDRIVMASAIDLTDIKNSWTLGIVDLARDVTSADLIKSEGGTKDQVGGREVIWTPRNAYLIPLKKRLLAQFSPPNRQELARWIKLEKQSTVTKLSPYLDQASNQIDRSAQVVVAMDLEDAFLPAVIKEHLKSSKVIPVNADRDKVSAVLASLKGFRYTAAATDSLDATLTIEFGESVAPIEAFAKPLLLETLSALGAELEDLAKWDVVAVGTTVVLKGKLSAGSSSRILSLFDLPTGLDDEATSSGAAPAETRRSPQSIAAASKRYYQSIRTILDDLKAQKATSQGGMAVWYGRYARKIDQLPVLDVDPDLLSFSQQLSEALRRVSSTYDGVSSASAYRKTMGTGYSYYGGTNVTAGDAARIRKQEDIYALKVYHDTWDAVENQLSAMRKALTVKYGVEF